MTRKTFSSDQWRIIGGAVLFFVTFVLICGVFPDEDGVPVEVPEIEIIQEAQAAPPDLPQAPKKSFEEQQAEIDDMFRRFREEEAVQVLEVLTERLEEQDCEDLEGVGKLRKDFLKGWHKYGGPKDYEAFAKKFEKCGDQARRWARKHGRDERIRLRKEWMARLLHEINEEERVYPRMSLSGRGHLTITLRPDGGLLINPVTFTHALCQFVDPVNCTDLENPVWTEQRDGGFDVVDSFATESDYPWDLGITRITVQDDAQSRKSTYRFPRRSLDWFITMWLLENPRLSEPISWEIAEY